MRTSERFRRHTTGCDEVVARSLAVLSVKVSRCRCTEGSLNVAGANPGRLLTARRVLTSRMVSSNLEGVYYNNHIGISYMMYKNAVE